MVGLFPESILNIPSEKWEQGLNCLVKSKEPFALRKREEDFLRVKNAARG